VGFWRHLRVIGLLPGVVTLVVPATIIYFTGPVKIGWGLASPLSWVPPLLGCILVGLGLFLMYQTISLFATVGEGTLAPWDPPRNFVVQGVYRYVRNPMISGVLFILLGEAVLLGSSPLLLWFLVSFAVNATYIPLIEEKRLARRFGDEYLAYKRNVPRWVPALGPGRRHRTIGAKIPLNSFAPSKTARDKGRIVATPSERELQNSLCRNFLP
jgi:protein-S-isoprenylcysteine O-methyltransferase Ste14